MIGEPHEQIVRDWSSAINRGTPGVKDPMLRAVDVRVIVRNHQLTGQAMSGGVGTGTQFLHTVYNKK